MIRPLRPLLLLSAAVLAAAACLPTRNNPFDPQDAPAAHLLIEDGGAPGNCAATSTSSLAPVATLAHGHCMVLDARATTFISGTSGGVTYTFFTLGTNAAGSAVPLATPGPAPVLVLGSATVRAFSLGQALHNFRVTVAQGGHIGTGNAQVGLLDTAPVALADPPRIFPLGGFPWQLGAPFDITFDASRSFDPDGDAIQYCWTAPNGVSNGCSASPTITYQVASTAPVNQHATLTVVDSYGQQTTVLAPITIGQPQAWAFAVSPSFDLPNLTAEIDESWRQFILPHEVVPSPGVNGTPGVGQVFVIPGASAADTELLALDVLNQSVDLYREQGFALLDSVPVTASQKVLSSLLGPVAMTVDTSSGTIWVITDVGQFGPAQRVLQKLTVSGSTLTVGSTLKVAAPTSESAGLLTNSYLQAQLATDAAGNIYYAATLDGQAVRAVAPTGVPLGEWTTDPGDQVSGLGRAANGEVWMVEGQSFVGSVPGSAAIVRLLSGNQTVHYPISGSPFTSGMAWIDGGRFWTWLDNQICLIDSNKLLAGAEVAAAIDVSIPSLQASFVNADPVSGEAWWQDSALDTLIQVFPDGTSTSQATSLLPQAVDASGDIVSVLAHPGASADGSGPIVVGQGADDDALRATFPLDGFATPDLTGGIWLGLLFQGELDHIGSDGTLLQRVTTMTTPSGPVAIPLVKKIIQSSNGTLWVRVLVENSSGTPSGEVLHLKADPAPSGNATLLSSPFPPFVEAEASIAAVRTGTPGVWVEDRNAGVTTYQVWDDSGAEADSIFLTPANEAQNTVAETDVSGSLCLATLQTSGAIALRTLTRTGVVTPVAQIASIGDERQIAAVEQGTLGGQEVCWVSWLDEPAAPPSTGTLNIQAYTNSATPARMANFSEPLLVPLQANTSLWATDPGNLWVLFGSQSQGPWTLQDVQFGAGTAGTLVALPPVPIAQFMAH